MAQGIFSQYDAQDLNRLAAKGILEKLRTIRQKIQVDFTARRIIWELVQNAKDNVAVSNPGKEQKVQIKIELKNNQLIFSHNNGYFTNENIRGLIRRYSSSEKDRDYGISDQIPATTGRFGTGFMTTHLLSERVLTKGVFKGDDDLFKLFSLPINRTGVSEKEIIKSIENSFYEVENSIHRSSVLSQNILDFNTEFIYELDDEGLQLAEIALGELNYCAGPTLINIPSLQEIMLINNSNTVYKILIKTKYDDTNFHFELAELQTTTESTESTFFVVLKNDDLKLILPVDLDDGWYIIKSISPELPKLFLDFPLIGTEELNIPFIISSPFFEPTESRNGVSLTGSEDRDTKINSKIINDAIELFQIFLDKVTKSKKWCNQFNLARFKPPKERDWINVDWYNKSVLKPIRNKLLQVPLVEVEPGIRKSIKNSENKDQVYFPHAGKREILEVIWKLSKELFPNNIPIKEHIGKWYDIIWDDCYKQNILNLTKDIEEYCDLSTLKSKLNKSQEAAVDWLNEYYDLLYFEGKFIDEIIKGSYAIFPNQNGKFKKKTELFIDGDIEEELKNTLLILNIDVRNTLLHKGVVLDNKYKDEQKNEILFSTRDQDFVIQTIIKSLIDNPKASIAVNHLLSLFSEDPEFPDERELIYQFNRKIYGSEIPDKKIINNWNKSIWDRIDGIRILRLVYDISDTKNLDGLKTLIQEDSIEKTLKWLQSFIDFLTKSEYEEKLNLKDHPILPNQNFEYKVKDDLFLDDGAIHEELKDISKVLGYDIRSELLHKDIFLFLPESRVKKNQYLAEEIAKLIKPIVKDPDQRLKYGDLFKRLYMWMTQNHELAQNIFGDIYEKRFLLMSDDVIVSNLKKAELLDDLLAGTVLTLEEIKEKIGFVEKSEEPNEGNENIETHFAFEFTPVDRSLIDKVTQDNSSYFPPGENLSFREKLLQLISISEPPWAGFVYHFTHLENALNIIKVRKILPRNKATFKNSAGSSFINTTLGEIKNFARFYFRPLTPTQYYNEGLGRETKAGDLPQCPVMIFFKFDLKEVLEKKENQCYVSNGNLRHYPTTKFGNDYEFLKSFNFKNLYCKYGECDHWSFINASQQEFIVKDEFDFSDIVNFQIICRSEFDKDVLINLIGVDDPIIDKILVDQSYYYQYNSFVEVESEEHILKVKIPYRGKAESIKIISTKKINSHIINDTIKSQKSVELETSYDGEYKIYYLNEITMQDWLIYASRSDNG